MAAMSDQAEGHCDYLPCVMLATPLQLALALALTVIGAFVMSRAVAQSDEAPPIKRRSVNGQTVPDLVGHVSV